MLMLPFMTYNDFLPCCQNLLKLWIGTTVNYASVVAEVQLNEDLIQSVTFHRCAFFLFYYRRPCLKTVGTLVLCSTAISDDKLRAPWQMFRFFSFPVSFVSQGLSLFCSAVADDILQAPWWMFRSFPIPVSFVSQGLSLFCSAVAALEWTNLLL